jgi:CHAT domain-containing protein
LLVGQVDFDDAEAPTTSVASSRAAPAGAQAFNDLPGTRLEILAIRDSFEEQFPSVRARVLNKANATKANFRTEAPKHRFLHLATHGFFAPETTKSALADDSKRRDGALSGAGLPEITGWHPGLLSGLVFAGANKPATPERESGILTALEVAEMDLGGCDLAVLSACETGLGKVAGGEGVLGLQRAFQVAGARTVVASLWSVDDKQTRDLMAWFYEGLWRKKGPPLSRAEALRQAQLRMLREGPRRGFAREDDKTEDLKTAPPYYWAAFVLSGDWR